MPAHAEPSLSLAEWIVLCLACERQLHGFALVRLLDADGEIGRIWRIPKPVIYRALQRLEQLGALRATEPQQSSQGPARSPFSATSRGRALATAWLRQPVGHNRDIRSELLAKLALLDRAGTDPGPLLDAQRDQLQPVADALAERLATAAGFERTLLLWRAETIAATMRFLEALRAPAATRTADLG